MVTTRQIERLWTAKRYGQLLRELFAQRPEGQFGVRFDATPTAATAAIAMIRLDELNQAHAPLYSALTRTLLAMQDRDGGWGEPAVTALCLRALTCSNGHGLAIEAGLAYLANLQKDNGTWPRGPIRRMDTDADSTAFILYELGDEPRFRAAVRLDEAIAWFREHEVAMPASTRRNWQQASLRCRARTVTSLEYASLS